MAIKIEDGDLSRRAITEAEARCASDPEWKRLAEELTAQIL